MGIRVPIYDKQVIPDIARMQPVPMSAANTGAEGIGQAVSGLGQSVEHIANVEMEIQKRRVQMQDTRSLVNFRDEARNKELAIEQYKLSNPDTSTWELFAQKQSEELRKYGETLPISNMGWEQLQPELDSIAGTVDGKTYNAGLLYRKTTLDAVQQEQKNTSSSVEYDLRKKIEAGTSPELSSKEAVDKLSVFMTKDEAELRVRNIADSAMMDRQRIEQGIEKNNINFELGIARQLGDKKLAKDYIMNSKLIPETQKATEVRNMDFLLNADSSEANKQLTDLYARQKLTIDEIQKRRAVLGDENYQSWTKIAMNPLDKKGNIVKMTELKSSAMDVWRGTLSRTEAESKIRESLADPNGINDEQFAAVYADLDREVKGYQAQDTKTYSIDATRLILGKDSGVMTFDALGNVTIDINKMLSPQAEFERKMHFVDLYNKEMSDYIAENPKVSKKDLYIKSQELKMTYMQAAKGTGTTPMSQNFTHIITVNGKKYGSNTGGKDLSKWTEIK